MDSHGSSSSGSRGSQHFLFSLFPISTVLEVVRSGGRHYSSQIGASGDAPSENEQIEIRIGGEQDEEMGISGTSSSGSSLFPVRLSAAGEPGLHRASDGDEALESQANGGSNTREGNNNQRYDFQPLTRWAEQIVPYTALLILVFVRQHLQGLAVSFWITAVLFKANDLVRKQTALKGERRKVVIGSLAVALLVHVTAIYWWYRGNAIWRPLILLPPRKIPKFWHAIFMIVVNDVMVRQVGMAAKCVVLVASRSTRGRHFRRQGQLLTLVEYLLLLYRALIPGPIWYRFFLNKEYGNMFSSLTTGLYLTFKLTSVFEKLRAFVTAARLLSRSEIQYGSHATEEEILGAGDMCAICQAKLHTPIALRCKHIFCEDCISEWFEREQTCPLCRAVVKAADLKSFSDGSTSLSIQFF